MDMDTTRTQRRSRVSLRYWVAVVPSYSLRFNSGMRSPFESLRSLDGAQTVKMKYSSVRMAAVIEICEDGYRDVLTGQWVCNCGLWCPDAAFETDEPDSEDDWECTDPDCCG